VEYIVAPRAYWKGYLKLSLVSCPIALYPATSEREKISFHQLNKTLAFHGTQTDIKWNFACLVQ
jgi:non-homologous end joining protein Ku